MSDGPDQPVLHLRADLRMDVDGVRAQVHGDGAEVSVRSDHPLRLARAMQRGLPETGRSELGIGAVADLLAGNGLSARLTGPRAEWARIGADVDSRLGFVLVHSRHVAAAPAVRAAVVAAAGVLGVAVLAALRARTAAARRSHFDNRFPSTR